MKHFFKSHIVAKILFFVLGLTALAWFLLRVIPKPSRAAYPCQRAAFPIASSFVIWLVGIFVSAGLLRKSLLYWKCSRFLAAVTCTVMACFAVYWFYLSIPASNLEADELPGQFEPAEGANEPMGTGMGIFPGRVVWKHDPDATSWDGISNYWWSPENTSQERIRTMLSDALRWLSGEEEDAGAWDSIFHYYNSTHGRGDAGYVSGEKIAIKLNLNQISSTGEENNDSFTTPQLVLALLEQLVTQAGVAADDITFYDALRIVPDVIVDRCQAAYPGVGFMDIAGQSGRVQSESDPGHPVHWSESFEIVEAGSGGITYVPLLLSEAAYHINIAGMKGHAIAGGTFCAKNLFGSILAESEDTGWGASPKAAGIHPYVAVHETGGGSSAGGSWSFDARPMGSYNVLVDLMGHRDLGAKTILYLIDGLYATRQQSEALSLVSKWSSFPFNDDWTSSLFISQDPVAIDSVALDFARSEPTMVHVYGNVDNYLHEAAEASNPPSGTVYDPEADGIPLENLGAHEHWNNILDKAYSRNLGFNYGIELISEDPTAGDQQWTISLSANPPSGGTVAGDGLYDNGKSTPIDAIISSGYRFSGWTGASGIADELDPTTTVSMDSDKTLVANFIKVWNLNVTSTDSVRGSVSDSGVYDHGSNAPVVAIPEVGYRFSSWSGNGILDTTDPTTTIAMTQDRTISANFLIKSTAGYNVYVPIFGDVTDINLIGPDMDFDKDGKSNFMEYAFVLDPTSAFNSNDAITTIHEAGGQRHGRLTFKVREDDPELGYAVQLSDDLTNWQPYALTFSGSTWVSSDTDKLTISSAVSNGDETWTLIVEDQTPISSGSPRFIRLEANSGY